MILLYIASAVCISIISFITFAAVLNTETLLTGSKINEAAASIAIPMTGDFCSFKTVISTLTVYA